MNNITNDLRVSRDFDTSIGKLTATAGFYKSRQTIATDWLWTSHLFEVAGGGNAALVNLTNAAGQALTQNGTYGYGATFFGNCCRRSYDVDYNTNAPFASLSLATGALTLDGSLRYDFGDAKGTIAGSDLGGGRVGVTSRDMNGDTCKPSSCSLAACFRNSSAILSAQSFAVSKDGEHWADMSPRWISWSR